jgi:hypothetical protein
MNRAKYSMAGCGRRAYIPIGNSAVMTSIAQTKMKGLRVGPFRFSAA